MPVFRALVFDLDDTLYPEHAYVISGFKAVAEWGHSNLGLDPDACHDELCAMHDAGIRGDTFNRLLDRHGLDRAHAPDMVAAYREHHPSIHPWPDVPELLDRLHRTYRLGLVSDGYGRVQRMKLDALQLADRFDAIVFSDDLAAGAWKPSPLPYLEAVESLGVAPSEAAYIGDNPVKDFLGARRAGMRSIRVRTEEGIYNLLEPASDEHEPDWQTSLNGLEALLAALAEEGTESTTDVRVVPARTHRS